MVISLIEIIKNKNRLRAKKETWGKLNEVSERRKAEKNVKVWESLGIVIGMYREVRSQNS